MDKREEFRTYMEAIGAEFEDAPKDHMSQEEMIDYHEGRLEPRRREEVQSHLVVCGECLAAFKDISDFFGSTPEDAESLDDLDVRRQWKAFRQRVETGREDRSGERRLGGILSSKAALVLAACLLIVAGLALVWAILLRQENRQMAERLHAQEKNSASKVERLERENRQLQERTSTLEQNARRADELELENRRLKESKEGSPDKLQSELARLRQPEVNAPIFDIFSREFNRRSGSEEGANRIKIPPAAQSVVLILSGEGQSDASAYSIEIAEQRGRSIWRGAGLKRDGQGNFVIRLSSKLLGKGEYRLKLYAQGEDDSKMLSEYLVVVE